MFIFVRQDLPIQHQLVQSNHATYMMASLLRPEEGIPNIVFIGVPDTRALNRVRAKLSGAKITHYLWEEPDFDFGMTAIATEPLDEETKRPLANYRLYSPGPAQAACGLTADGRANAEVAQCRAPGN